ncbi:O-antigen translocase [Dokdonia sp. R78006]|uniref:O-antigen translocase n=1 Tax=Dokdonia sp. R78006 TaxID=3093866 RepID=UPI0036D407B9
MLSKIRASIGDNTLLKIGSINAVSVILQILGGLITSKLIAIYLGERGMALLGHLRNFMTSSQAAGNLGLSNGIVKYVATGDENSHPLSKLLSTAVIVSLVATIIVSSMLYVGASYFNAQVFGEGAQYIYVFKLLAIALPFITLNGILLAVINGQSAYKKVVKIQIFSNLIGLAITVLSIIYYGVQGALFSLIVSPAVILVITLIALGKQGDVWRNISLLNFDTAALRKLGSYTLMALFSMIVLPLVYITIRKEIGDGAGYWDAMTRISSYYVKFVATLMTLYILPQLAKATTDESFRKEIFGFYKTVLPLFGVGLVVIYLLRDFIVGLIFTEDFVPMTHLFKWQLLGDFFKVASIVIGYQIIAKNNLKLFLITEIISLGVIYCSGIYLVRKFGYEGASMGHCFSYFIHLLVLLFIFRKPLFGKTIAASE